MTIRSNALALSPFSQADGSAGAAFARALVIGSLGAWLPLCSGALEAAAPPPPAGPHWSAVDLSLLVSPELPCVWPVGMTQYLLTPNRVIGPGAYNRDLVMIDEHTGTQFDAPAHFVPPPDSGLPGAGPMGKVTGELVPVWRFVGEACVIDLSPHLDDARPGESFLIEPDLVLSWEQKHRKLGPGDIVLFRSGYTDRYYQPFPQGDRFVNTVLRNQTPGWPAPTPQTMKLLGERQVTAAGTDGASMGPVPTLAAATHLAGAQYGLVWTECLTGLDKLPPTGAFYALLPNKHAHGSGGECRVLAITDAELAKKLIDRAKSKNVADLTALLDEDLPITWPGEAAGLEATRYLGKTLNAFDPARGPYFARTHVLDSQVGTHLVSPSYALPGPGFDNARYAPAVRQALEKYEARFGKRGTSELTVDKLPLDQLMGPAYVIDVPTPSTAQQQDGKSPQITLEAVQEQDRKRPIKAGDVVIFHTGYCDKYLAPIPAGNRLMAEPLAGKAPGWPAPQPEVIVFLAERGVRLIGTDAPTMGGVEADAALPVYWAAGSRGMCLVEFLTGLDALKSPDAFFLFGPVKLKDAHGSYGRAIALY